MASSRTYFIITGTFLYITCTYLLYMKAIKYCILLVIISVCRVVSAQAQDSLRFSLLTCAPGEMVYELFGHTAIRYQNFTRYTDIVFNYGMFDFDTPNFAYRFAKGQADYQLGVNSFDSFKRSYARRGSSVYEQELNLTAVEKQTLQRLLFDNFKPENRVYRYNYFFNNCTTCARDQIEKAIQGKVIYPEGEKRKSFRGIVHEYSVNCPWDQFGMDLLLGAEADEEINNRLQMFAPFYMRDFASKAYILSDDGSQRPLVSHEFKIVNLPPRVIEPGFILSPMACAIIFLFVNLCIAYLQIKKRRVYWGWDIILYGAQGIAGCVIAFLFFFSTHPTVGSNWMLALLHPLALFYIPWSLWRCKKGAKDHFSMINLVYLTFFIISMPFIPQDFNLTILPLALGLLVNAASHVLATRK